MRSSATVFAKRNGFAGEWWKKCVSRFRRKGPPRIPVLGAMTGLTLPAVTLVVCAIALPIPEVEAGDILVSNYTGHNVLIFNADTGASVGEFISAGAGGLFFPADLLFGPNGNLFIVNRQDAGANYGVKEFDGQTGVFIRDIGFGTGLSRPNGLAFRANGNLLVSSKNTDNVLEYEFDGNDWVFVGEFIAGGSGGLDAPFFMTFGPNGNLFVTSEGTDSIIEYDGQSGSPIGTFASLPRPAALDFAPNDNLFSAGRITTNDVREFDTDGNLIRILEPPGATNLAGLLFAPSGQLLVVSFGSNKILKYDPVTGALLGEFVGTSGGLSSPWGITIQPAAVCGNGMIEGAEVCDDGNTADCDGCRGDCSAVEGGCGDGFCCVALGDDSCSCPEDCGTAVTCDADDPASGSPCGDAARGGGGELCNAVPTVSEWGLIVMVLLALATGTILYGRRRLTIS